MAELTQARLILVSRRGFILLVVGAGLVDAVLAAAAFTLPPSYLSLGIWLLWPLWNVAVGWLLIQFLPKVHLREFWVSLRPDPELPMVRGEFTPK